QSSRSGQCLPGGGPRDAVAAAESVHVLDVSQDLLLGLILSDIACVIPRPVCPEGTRQLRKGEQRDQPQQRRRLRGRQDWSRGGNSTGCPARQTASDKQGQPQLRQEMIATP